ncbi:unnamed protein product [Bursaphelenchus okinawaensis]|uniref:Protein phosphatase methylesterase 1 n=1 Tax=Bursaphelenchus okinawaensis TaxID=465554 RepID=A0A811KIA5_9BILA|nr:unnamed protein product [Bursaphelenchus okinawaensis]CAG9103357.1 unnamed protein product [Bursaphelenchus okinawaensis]
MDSDNVDNQVEHNTNVPAFRDFSPLEYTNFFDKKLDVHIGNDVFNVYLKGEEGPVFYLLHGGGYSGLSWAVFVEDLCSKVKCRVVAPDLRGHGLSRCTDDNLSSEKQIEDIANIYNNVFESLAKKPPLIIVGHSMGGALAVRAVHANLLPNVQALAVIDVVEGSAMGNLSLMTQVLRNRPKHFATLEKAIKWCVDSGMTRNLKAAKVSMPSQLIKDENGKDGYHWRVNLGKTQEYWVGWFKGLSKLFLECKPVKILILANVDRLDKELMIGQMQGAFQYEVLHKVGHAVHEDSPDKVADIFANMVKRYQVIFNKA